MLPGVPVPVHDPGPWIKFWWKGVDVVADVVKSLVTAGIVAVVAYLTWEKKKRREQALELEHERNKKVQEEQLARQFASERAEHERKEAREEKIRRWKAELADLLNRFPRKESGGTVVLYQRYAEWLERNGLIAFGKNLEVAREWSSAQFSRQRDIERFRGQIAHTDLPKVNDDTFPW